MCFFKIKIIFNKKKKKKKKIIIIIIITSKTREEHLRASDRPTNRPTDRPTDRPTMTHLTKQPFLTLLSPSDTATISSRFPYDFPTISLRRRKLQKSFKCLTKSCLKKLPQKIASKVASKVASKIASKKFASCSIFFKSRLKSCSKI